MTSHHDTAQGTDADVLYSNEHVRVSRRPASADGVAAVVKVAIGNQAIRRLAHEVSILKQLAQVDGVVRIADLPAEANTVLLKDEGASALSSYLASHKLSPAQLVAFTTAFARILSAVHKTGVVHKDICPANVLIHPGTLQPTLIDFNIATGPGYREDPAAQTEMVGTWAYMSPEHTGRTGRATDSRSDLYSLGITLYEVLTGQKPFRSEDLLELVHDHLVRVPDAPSVVNPEVPALLSDVVMRLLEKEPDRRYQSAEGLGLDLTRIGELLASGDTTPFALGQFDFGVHLNAPAKLIGRDPELTALRAATLRLKDGLSPCLLMTGVPGVGRSALLDQIRPMVSDQRAWFVSGKFTSERQGTPEAAFDAFQALGRQLMAQPEDQLAPVRERIRAAFGDNLGIGLTQLPEFEMLLGKHPALEITDPAELEARTAQAALGLLQAVATPERPLVLVYDDVQWAPSLSIKLLDAVVSSTEPLPGLLVVCAYQVTDVAEDNPVRALMARWKTAGRTPPQLAVGSLSADAAAEFVGQMLRLPVPEAGKLAAALHDRTDHNPRAIVSLLNALRNDGVLVPGLGVWNWTPESLRRYVGEASPAELKRRLAKLPADALGLIQSVACLGLSVSEEALLVATALDAKALKAHAAAALDEGLLVAVSGERACYRLANGRVRVAVLSALGVDAGASLHLAFARRLNATSQPAFAALTAEQYLGAVDVLADETERRHAAGLFDAAAARLRLSDVKAAEGYYVGAYNALKPVARADDAARMFELKREHHRALFEQGRLDEGDALYAELQELAADTPIDMPEPTRVQIYSLMNRRRPADGVALGLGLMAKLGVPKPDDIRPALGEGFKRVTMWYRGEEKLREFDRAEISEPLHVAWTKIIPETSNPSFFVDPTIWAWLAFEAHRIWVEYGPSPRLLSSVGSLPMMLVGAPQDYRGAYLTSRHVLAVGEARHYEPATSFARCIFGISASHWVDPIEKVVDDTFRRARKDLHALGDESFVAYTYVACDLLLDCAPTLDIPLAEIDDGLAFAARSKNNDFTQRYLPRRQLVRSLTGKTSAAGAFTDAEFDEEAYVKSFEATGPTAASYHMFRAIGSAIFGDIARLSGHVAYAVPLGARTPGYYTTAIARMLAGLAQAEKARALPVEERAPVIAEIDGHLTWLTARAADAPENFLHLQRWLEAERAWVADSVWTAGAAFDVAVTESALHARPWHRAIIAERAGMFHLAHGLESTARPLLVQACETYDAWGAAGKVKELRRQHAFLRSTGKRAEGGTRSTSVVDSAMVDMMAVLRASQALSSETSLVRLTQQVGKVLGAITGATGVQLIVRADEGSNTWVMASSLGNEGAAITVEEAGAAGDVPLSVFRYAERTGELLVIDDATGDDRFSADPYVQRFDQCSLMLSPILKQGQLNAMLVLENNQRRKAFSGDRLDSVAMIAGQLSVSLDNALLYASLEKRVAERTAQLRQKTNDINAMLQNMPQGVLTVVTGGLIHPEYSAYLETIFETKDIADQHVMQLVFDNTSVGADALSQVDAAVASCIGEDEMNYEFNSHLLVTEFDKTLPDGRVKSLALSWSPICDESGNVDKLMLCVRDVTELKRLENEANTRKRELQMIGEILAVSQEKFHEFIDSARVFIEDNKRLIQAAESKNLDSINLLFRNMHTIKGNARTYNLLGLTNQVHITEQHYDDLRQDEEVLWDQAALLAQLDEVKVLVDKYSHVNDTVLGRKGPGRRAGVEKFLMVERDTVQQALQLLVGVDQNDAEAMRGALQHVGRVLNMIGTQTLPEILSGTLESLPSLAQELGKEVPNVEIDERGIVVRTQASGLLKNLFTHLLRNSVDHGIEPAAVREAQGKPAAGLISLSLAVDDGHLWIRLRDDGRGLAIARIRQKAVEAQLIAEGDKTSPEDIAQLIFNSGLSTAAEVTEVSGRGVGMDAVKGFIEKEGGTIAINLLDDKTDADFRPFETVIALPDKFAASLGAAMSFDALCARIQAAKNEPSNTRAAAL